MPSVSTSLSPVHSSAAAASTLRIPFTLTPWMFREDVGKVRIDITLRSLTALFACDLVIFGADTEDDDSFVVSTTNLLTAVDDEGVTRMTAFVAVPSDVEGKRLIAFGVACYNSSGSAVEFALISLDVHTMVAT